MSLTIKMYTQEQLSDQTAQKLLSLIKKARIIPQNCTVEVLLVNTTFGALHDCIVCLDTKIVVSKKGGNIFRETGDYPYSILTIASMERVSVMNKLRLHIGGNADTIDIQILREDAVYLTDFINSKIEQIKQNNNNSAPKTSPVSTADEIAKFHALKEQGIISEEEFNAKKKELLGM